MGVLNEGFHCVPYVVRQARQIYRSYFCIQPYTHSIAVDASSVSFQYYTNGIYYDTDCSKTNLNHAMLVVGYGTDSYTGLDYWILKNRQVISTLS